MTFFHSPFSSHLIHTIIRVQCSISFARNKRVVFYCEEITRTMNVYTAQQSVHTIGRYSLATPTFERIPKKTWQNSVSSIISSFQIKIKVTLWLLRRCAIVHYRVWMCDLLKICHMNWIRVSSSLGHGCCVNDKSLKFRIDKQLWLIPFSMVASAPSQPNCRNGDL